METSADAGIVEVQSEPLGEPPPPEPESGNGDPIGNLLRRLTGK
jgi:penicillin-binding protein 1A